MRKETLEEMTAKCAELYRQSLLHSARILPRVTELGKHLLTIREEGPPRDFFQTAEEEMGMHPMQAAILLLAGCIELSPEEWNTLQLCAALAEAEAKRFEKEDGL
jgi:hypothetical protein